MKLTRLEFRDRFTTNEKRAIYAATATSVDLKIYLDELALAEFVDTENASTAAGVQMLETYGLIGAGRAAEILGQVQTTNQQVVLLGKWGEIFPGVHDVLGTGNGTVILAVGEFALENTGAA